jgi:hypothetical protein
VAELALDHDQRHTFACHLNGVRMSQLVWREAAPNARGRRDAPEVGSSRRRPPTVDRVSDPG